MKKWTSQCGCEIYKLLGGRSNVFLLKAGNLNILIDTGPGYCWGILMRRLRKSGENHVDYLILTHAHHDHAENAARLRNKFGLKVVVHANESQNLMLGNNPLPEGTNPFSRLIIKLANTLQLKQTYEPCPADIKVETEYDFKKLGINALIIHTPGHSSGSMSIVLDNEIVIAGDALFGISSKSIFPPFADDVDELIKSWKKLLDTNCLLFLPAHGNQKTRNDVLSEYLKRSKA